MREIVLDTETTGLSPEDGHRITEIGCVELYNHVPTGRVFQQYVNPERDIPADVLEICGLTREFLAPFPVFSKVADAFLDFIEDSPLVIHNAKFDMKFLNAELAWCQKTELPFSRAIDTLMIARRQFPGAPASLDALTKRFNIQIPREKHGALLDAQILAEVYIELKGGRQQMLYFTDKKEVDRAEVETVVQTNFPRRSFPVSAEEQGQFRDMLKKIKEPVWAQYLEDDFTGV